MLNFIRDYGAGIGGFVVSAGALSGFLWFLFRSAVGAAVKPELTEINGRLDTVQEDISSLKEGQAALRADVSSLKEGQTTLRADVSDLKADVSGLKEGQAVLIKLVQEALQSREVKV
ncbi:MAG: hypothetical protein WA902_05860 [Thermosynechococcaceae cyanobacterium]